MKPSESRPDIPAEIIEQRISDNVISRDEVEAARKYWKEHLRLPTLIGTGEWIFITETDFDQLILEERIRRKPQRILSVLENIYEVYGAKYNRRRAMSIWHEEAKSLHGYAILDPGGTVRTIHVVRIGEAGRLRRKRELLWKRDP